MKQLLRKLIALTLALLLTFAAFPFNLVEMPVFAATSGTTGSCRWSVENSVLTISGNGAMGNYDYTYASDYTTLITSAPWGTNIKAVVIEEGVTTVGKYAFFGCSKIASVSLPDSLITIRESAFRDCEFLYSVTIPDRVTKVEPFAFRGCLSLTSITIGESVTDFGNTGIVLTDCPSLTSIIVNGDNPLFSSKGNCLINTVEKRLVLGCKNSVIPSDGSVKIVGDSAFGGCSSLQSIVIPEGITRIAAQAFYGCTSLSSVSFSEGLQTIDGYAFQNCTALSSVILPDSLESIGLETFDNTAWYEAQPEGVVYLGDFAYGYKGEGLSELVLRDGTEGIADYAFSGMETLQSVVIPDGVKIIGDSAFACCASLDSITLPDSITSFGSDAFYDTAWYYAQPDGVLYLGKYVFGSKGTLPTSIEIKEGTLGIASGAFYYRYEIESVAIPDSVTFIGDSAFTVNSSLVSITIPKGVTELGNGAFASCHDLTTVTIEGNLSVIREQTFSGCNNLTSITLPNSLSLVALSAFFDCPTLSEVWYVGAESEKEQITIESYNDPLISASWHYIDSLCDAECNTCSATRKPAGHSYDNGCDEDCNGCGEIREISGHIYDNICDADCNNCGTIREIAHSFKWIVDFDATCGKDGVKHEECTVCREVRSENTAIPTTGNHIYDNDSDTTCNECGFVRSVSTILSGTTGECTWTLDGTVLTIIGNGMMGSYSSSITAPWGKEITEVVIEDGVTRVGNYAFYNCASLTSIIIPDSVTRIGHVAFYGCTSLVSLTIPDSVTSIGEAAFYECTSLVSAIIPDRVTGIGPSAFYNCTSLVSVTIPDSVTRIGNYAFYGCTSLALVTIPDSVTTVGSSAFRNCKSLTSITIGDSVTTIGDWAFVSCKSLISVTIGDSVTTIGENAFMSCSSLTLVTIPDSVTTIGAYAFYGCESLTSATIGDSVTSIGQSTFYECESLTSVTIGESVTSIGKSAFIRCTSLVSVTIPDSVTTIGSLAFYGCESLTSATIGDSVTTIGNYAFYECESLTSVTIGESVADIGEAAFIRCTSLTLVAIPDSVTTIGTGAFYGCDSLTSVTIGNSVTTIGTGAFAVCSSLEFITVKSGNPVYYSVGNCLIERATKTLLQGCNNSVIPADGSVEIIGLSAFRECSSLTSVTIPDSVTGIGDYAFYNCDKISDVWYEGTEEDREAIAIGADNTDLTNATWHYNACMNSASFAHLYDNDFDATCNNCGAEREVAFENAPTFYVNTEKGKAGDTVEIIVSIKENPGIVSLKVDVGYDTNVLELVDIKGGEFDSTTFGPISANPIAVNWCDAVNPNNTTNGAVAILTFKIKEGAPLGDTEITLSYDPENVYDFDFKNVFFVVESGKVTVIDYIPGDVNCDGEINNKDVGLLQRYINGWDVEIDLDAADVTRDGKINNKDLALLQRFISGWNVELK